MMRPWHIWTVFGASLALFATATGWISWTVLDLDRARQVARRQAGLEENVRLSLWRMESDLTPIIVGEAMRPHFTYNAFHAAGGEYSIAGKGGKGFHEILVPSPLLAETPEDVLLHFQIRSDGRITSPQVPSEDQRKLAEELLGDSARLEAAAERLAQLRGILEKENLFAVLPEDPVPPEGLVLPGAVAPHPGEVQVLSQQVLAQEEPAQLAQIADAPGVQLWRNDLEWQARTSNIQRAASNTSQVQGLTQRSPEIREGILSPLWVGEELLLARRASIRGQDCIQGCWLDWAGLEKKLLARIQDILPHADLVPARSGGEEDGSRRLAALPVILAPGELPSAGGSATSPGGSPERLSLVAAWACLALAAVAVAALLKGIVALSERRGAFVSAVTHELRTPLTTFRMYTEMLQAGMVAGEEKRREYLATLSTEAHRLSHLVENVLAYARLERGRFTARSETVSIAEVLGRVKGRLEDRARAAGMRLEVQAPEDVLSATVKVDVSAVEQILFNLVDNACKYAVEAGDKPICLSAARRDGGCELRVRDRGPGISPAEAKRLFQPFSKSARQAAHSAPGVGLGLALSRRLAREMGGDLRLDPAVDGGAAFILSLKG